MILGVGCEFSKKFLIFFFLNPTKPLERALMFQLAIDKSFSIIS